MMNKKKILECINELKQLQDYFTDSYGVMDIYSNSKFYEIIIANQLTHNPIPGHSGSRDACDKNGNEFEYKHFKETSSNHSWTFNDYSDNIINHMHNYKFIFAHIDDKNYPYPGILDWYYYSDGRVIQNYLSRAVLLIENNRKMINVSPNQLESVNLHKTFTDKKAAKNYEGQFQKQLLKISEISAKLEKLTGVTKILTSNKLYEVLVALELNHKVNPENGGREGAHDATDEQGNTYEYKVYKSTSWNFQDISDAVLEKYYNDKEFILAVVDKDNIRVKKIYSVIPDDAVPVLKRKLKEKIEKAKEKGKKIRRKQVSLTISDIKKMNSFKQLL